MPKVKMNLKYKPMKKITAADHHLYHIPKVFADSLNFNWHERDFEITSEERHFLQSINSQIKNGVITIPASVQGQTPIMVEQKPITDDDFEGFIDTIEKIVAFTKRKDEKSLIDCFQR